MSRVRQVLDGLRASLFALPAAAMVIAFVAARLLAGADGGSWVGDSTVDSSRAVLTTVAGTTATFASVAFSISLLVLQQASAQYSPRVVSTLTREPFNRRAVALVMATVTFSLVTLQRVEGASEDGGSVDVPRLSTALAVLLGLASILAVVAAINHTASRLDLSTILDRVVAEAERHGVRQPPEDLDPLGRPSPFDPERPSSRLAYDADGWVRAVDVDALAGAIGPGTCLSLEAAPGRYAIGGANLARVQPPLGDDDRLAAESAVRRAVSIGPTRTFPDDPTLGLRQLVDVALRALSPGINDPTTAVDAAFHMGSTLTELLGCEALPTCFAGPDGRVIVVRHLPDDDDIAAVALDELRSAAADHPSVAVALFQVVADVVDAVEASGYGPRAAPLVERAALLRDQAAAAAPTDVDRRRVVEAFAQRFPDHA